MATQVLSKPTPEFQAGKHRFIDRIPYTRCASDAQRDGWVAAWDAAMTAGALVDVAKATTLGELSDALQRLGVRS
jgi:hypothetical protein